MSQQALGLLQADDNTSASLLKSHGRMRLSFALAVMLQFNDPLTVLSSESWGQEWLEHWLMIEVHLLVTDDKKGAPSDTGACIGYYLSRIKNWYSLCGRTFKVLLFFLDFLL